MDLTPPKRHISRMGQIVYSCQYLVSFSTKKHFPLFSKDIGKQCEKLIQSTVANAYKTSDGKSAIELLRLETAPDMVTMIVDCPATLSIQSVVVHIKKKLATALMDAFPYLVRQTPCIWTRSAFIATLPVEQDVLDKYHEVY